MKKFFSCTALIFTSLIFAFSQEKPVKFTVTVSTDSILMDNFFEVKFTLENANGKNFEAPDFDKHFNVVSGPNFSTSMSMMNGDMTQSMTITYYLEPREIGDYYIMPASVEADGKILETVPLEVLVVPNPDGIKQSPKKGTLDSFQFNFGGNPFDFSFPDLEDINPNLLPPEPPKQEQVPEAAPKKKRKTTRI